MKEATSSIAPFVDESGRITQLPAKQSTRTTVLLHLAEKFEVNRNYSEKEVNAICQQWHTFHDYFVLRRGLVDTGLLVREQDGSRYWRSPMDSQNRED